MLACDTFKSSAEYASEEVLKDTRAMPPSCAHDGTQHTADSAADGFACDNCGQGNFTCITFVKPAGERRQGGGLGFDVSRDHTQCLPPARDDRFYVRGIIAGGLADQDGRLKEGITPGYFGINFHTV